VNIPDWPRFKDQEFQTTAKHSIIPYRCLGKQWLLSKTYYSHFPGFEGKLDHEFNK